MCEKLITNAKLQHSVQTTKNQASLRCKNLLTKQTFWIVHCKSTTYTNRGVQGV